MPRQICLPDLFATSVIILLSFALVTFSPHAVSAIDQQYGTHLGPSGFTAQQFEKKVKEYLDIPYQRGGVSRQGMDCSGFSKTIYSQLFGIDLPHTSVGQFRMGDLKKIEARQMKPGDLIFFANKKKKKINHVGVYLSDHKFIHASSSQGVMVSSLDESYWKKRFVGSKRHVALGVPKESTIVKIRSERKKRYK